MNLTSQQAFKVFGLPGLSTEGRYMTTILIKKEWIVETKCLPPKIYCNKAIGERLLGVFDVLYKQGNLSLIKEWGGCYVVRKKRGLQSYSLHSWGLAVDINMTGNGLGDTTPAMDKRIILAFKVFDFNWGGDWSAPRTDGMHFELRGDKLPLTKL